MRIIAGRFKGRRIDGPRGPGVRPTSDRLRETLFDVLADRVDGATFLDAFAGTGAVGIEALSRGASRVTFVESDRRTAALLADNLGRCQTGPPDGACMIVQDAFERARVDPADLVWMDPPYDWPDFDAVLARAGELVTPMGLVILEHAKRRAVPDRPPGLERTRVLVAGDSALSFFVPAAG